jgi:hypothetical protein
MVTVDHPSSVGARLHLEEGGHGRDVDPRGTSGPVGPGFDEIVDLDPDPLVANEGVAGESVSILMRVKSELLGRVEEIAIPSAIDEELEVAVHQGDDFRCGGCGRSP